MILHRLLILPFSVTQIAPHALLLLQITLMVPISLTQSDPHGPLYYTGCTPYAHRLLFIPPLTGSSPSTQTAFLFTKTARYVRSFTLPSSETACGRNFNTDYSVSASLPALVILSPCLIIKGRDQEVCMGVMHRVIKRCKMQMKGNGGWLPVVGFNRKVTGVCALFRDVR